MPTPAVQFAEVQTAGNRVEQSYSAINRLQYLGYCRPRALSLSHDGHDLLAAIHLLLVVKISLQPNQFVFQHFDETLRVEPIGVQRFRYLFFGW